MPYESARYISEGGFMKTGNGIALACLGGVLLGITFFVNTDPARALPDDPADAATAIVEPEKDMAAIPPLNGKPLPAADLKKILEPTEEKAAIPGRADEKPFKPSRKAAPEPEKMMAIIPDNAGSKAPENNPVSAAQ